MAYELQLVQINAGVSGLSRSNTAWGFPANTNFHTLLMSYWMCGPWYSGPGAPGSPGIWPEFMSASFFGFGLGGSPFIRMTNQALGSGAHFFTGAIPPPQPTSPVGCLLHFMMSVDTHAQVVQVYINDRPVTVTSPTWGGSPPYDFNVGSLNIWAWDVSGVISTGIHPALGDAWISNTPSFVDLSVVANRRKFIGHDMTAVDLGATGTAPFGYQPAMYMSVRPGGAATDILNNLGVGGGAWGYTGGTAPTFQTDGVCSAIPIPPTLAMDNLFCVAPAKKQEKNLIFLSWSDDRGHSYGNAVPQPIGDRGEYLTVCQWQRLGMARDRVFKIEWSCPIRTALQGAWIEADTSAKT